jgi:hypothetical protein
MSPALLLFSEGKMRILITAAIFSALALAPASAKMMACTKDNLAKSVAAMKPEPTAGNKELAAANSEMGHGEMKKACMHYFKSQKLSMAK